jgi:hypothetical protein
VRIKRVPLKTGRNNQRKREPSDREAEKRLSKIITKKNSMTHGSFKINK